MPATPSELMLLPLRQYVAAQGYGPIALTRYSTGHFTLALTLNHLPAHFLLDPGSSHTLIELTRAAHYGSRLEESERQGTGVGGSVLHTFLSPENRVVFDQHLAFGSQLAYVLSLEHVNAAFRLRELPEIDGVIGADLLEQGAAILDYATRTLYLKAVL